MSDLLRRNLLRRVIIFGGDDRRGLLDLASQNVALDEVGEPDVEFVADERLRGDGKDLCAGGVRWLGGECVRFWFWGTYGQFLPG